MTFDELLRKVAAKNTLSIAKTRDIVTDAIGIAARSALSGERAPLFPHVGRFATVRVRASGRKPDGSLWSRPPRIKLTFVASKYTGGNGAQLAPAQPISAATAA